jgi:ribose transport system ATP-binding protein
MDEPTSALTPHEIDQLFQLLKRLTTQGVGIIFISHRMEEIFALADRVTVLRDGRKVANWPVKEVGMNQLVQAMVGRPVSQLFPKVETERRGEAIRVEGLERRNVLHRISFSAYQGEILGIAGLVGSGRTELARAIFGADAIDAGTIYIKGQAVSMRSPRQAIQNGLGFLTEDRKTQGLVLTMTLESNLALTVYDFLSRLTVIRHEKRRQLAKDYVERLKIRPPLPERQARYFSGGNQQKVVLGKWLARQTDILIFDEPTRGIDVGAKAEVHQLMNDLARSGKCVLMISSELPEILNMSDRILVMREGRLVAQLNRQEATQELVMEYATGVRPPTGEMQQ